MTVDLFKLIAAQDSLGLAPSLTVIIEVSLPEIFQYSIAGFADGFIMKDVDRENWQRLGNMQETLSFDLYGPVVERADLSGYRARVMVNPNGSIYQFENLDRGVIGFGWLDKDKRFIFNMTLPCTTTRTLLDMLQRQSFRDTDAPNRELVRPRRRLPVQHHLRWRLHILGRSRRPNWARSALMSLGRRPERPLPLAAVVLRMGIINLRHPQDGRPNLVGSVCGFDLLRLDL